LKVSVEGNNFYRAFLMRQAKTLRLTDTRPGKAMKCPTAADGFLAQPRNPLPLCPRPWLPGADSNCLAKKRLESGHVRWEFPRMKTLTVDDRQRIRLPKVKPGEVFAYEPNSDGTIKLVPVVAKPGSRRVVARLVKRGERLFFQVPNGYTLDPEAIGKAVAEERESRS